MRSQSPEGTENYRSYKTGAATRPVQHLSSLFFTNGRLVGAIPTCSHVRCVGLSGDGLARVPCGRRVFLIPGRRLSCRVHLRPSLALAVCHEALDHISQEQRRPHMLGAGFLLSVTAALVEHVRVCCRGSLGRARAASVTAARVSMCSADVVCALCEPHTSCSPLLSSRPLRSIVRC